MPGVNLHEIYTIGRRWPLLIPDSQCFGIFQFEQQNDGEKSYLCLLICIYNGLYYGWQWVYQYRTMSHFLAPPPFSPLIPESLEEHGTERGKATTTEGNAIEKGADDSCLCDWISSRMREKFPQDTTQFDKLALSMDESILANRKELIARAYFFSQCAKRLKVKYVHDVVWSMTGFHLDITKS